MTIQKPFHTTPHGGSIVCLQGLTGRMFRACSLNKCTYTADLHAAKSYLDCLENKKVKFLPSPRNKECIPVQRKTTLKWNAGEEIMVLIRTCRFNSIALLFF